PNASLQLAKATLDAYAGQICDEQQQRQREESKKRKRTENGLGKGEILKIRKLHVDGFESGQVWQQARRIITSALQDSKSALQELEDRKEIQVNGVNGDAHIGAAESAEDVSDDDSADNGSDLELEDSEGLIEGSDEDEEIDEEDLEDDAELSENDMEDGLEDLEEEDESGSEDESEEAPQELVEDPNGL
ncbi:hypothetical protein PC116_g34390, partial [Phytophthora cactorum]